MTFFPVFHFFCSARRVLLLLVVFFGAAGFLGAADRPNFIFVLADDLGYGDLGCYGQERIQTPRLDRMAEEGMCFTDAYAGATICAPSRSVLMTGQHVGHTRIRGNRPDGEPQRRPALLQEDLTVATVLKLAGYSNAVIGKWGLGDMNQGQSGLPLRQGFDLSFGYLDQSHAHNYYPTFLWRNETRIPLANTVPNEGPNGTGISDNKAEYSHQLFMDEALKFVRDHKDEPFFLYFACTLPHANNENRVNGSEIPDYGIYQDKDWPEVEKGYAAMVTRLDHDLGRILDLLEELGLDENTLVIFASDNGPHAEGGHDASFFRSAGPLRGIKRSQYEGGIRVPMIARWPGKIPAGRTSDAICYFADIFPTFSHLAGASVPEGIDGVNITATLQGKKQAELDERFLYWEFHEQGFQQASRRNRWKALRNKVGEAVELYDLKTDIQERHDLAKDHPDIVSEFEAFFANARTESKDWPVSSAPVRGE